MIRWLARLTRISLFVVGAVLALSACSVGPTYNPPAIAASVTAPPDEIQGVSFVNETQTRWWQKFNDQTLNTLIEKALVYNTDIRVAVARLAQARALAGETRAGLLPRIGVGVQAQRERSSANRADAFPGEEPFSEWSYQIGFDANWELDLFGANRLALEAARNQADAAAGVVDATVVSVAAEVARGYINLRTLQTRLDIAEDAGNSLAKTLTLTEKRVSLGDASTAQAQQARSAYLTSLAVQRDLQVAVEQTVRALSVLTGQQPNALDSLLTETARPIPALDNTLEIAYPAVALSVRPDVYAAERTLAATTAQIGAVTAQLYPRITLIGNGGYLSTETGTLFDQRSLTGLFGPQIALPLFTGGAIRSRIKASSAKNREALAQFDNTVLNALLEIHNGLSALHHAREKESLLNDAADQAGSAVLTFERRYRFGAENLLTVLEIKQGAFQAKDGAALARAEASLAAVVLYKATAGAPINTEKVEK